VKWETKPPVTASNAISLPVPPATACIGGAAQRSDASTRFPNWMGILGLIVLHVACLAVFLTGTDPVALALCLACYLVRMLGITVGYHRYFSHRAYKTSRAFQFLLAWIGCCAFQKGPLWWAAHHRHHHRYSDTLADVHSPRTRSGWWAHLGWILAADYNETNWSAVRDWTRYPELRWLNRNHWLPALALGVFCLLVGGWSGLVWGFFISTVLSHHAVFAVNSLCHLVGRRRYATPDASRNNLFVALITLGEGWHNNHHHYQSSANQGFFWWEIDMSYYLIRLLGWTGLVWDIRRPPPAKVRNTAPARARLSPTSTTTA
jgi:stearoyl-CoA desaturase (Delta-9 desaturase)